MNILVFDTETTSLDKPFCYNVGYVIYNTETDVTLQKREYVIEQIWHNLPLFACAYYADKRPIYVNKLRARKIKLEKFGNICQQMIRDIKTFNVQFGYAYNSSFDKRVFEFNCDWFKCCNPFELIPVIDIRGNVHEKIAFTLGFQAFCDNYERFTEKGNYSTTAETLFQYITENADFTEEHTALSDSEIELQVLINTIERGCKWGESYKVYPSIPREFFEEFERQQTFKIKFDGVLKEYKYIRRRIKGKNAIELQSKDYTPKE